jgi:predicted nucleic acid-binding protein
MIAVADASPLIGLAKASRLRLLHRLYGDILIPPQVYADVVTLGRRRSGAIAVANAVAGGWMKIVPVRNKRLVPPQFAGMGEGEAIALALERKADVLLLDDRAARNYCTRVSLRWDQHGRRTDGCLSKRSDSQGQTDSGSDAGEGVWHLERRGYSTCYR